MSIHRQKVWHRNDIIIELAELVPNAEVVLLDRTYNAITSRALDRYRKEFGASLFANGIERWEKQHDCDDKALEAYVLARRKHRLLRSPDAAESLLFGFLCYIIGGTNNGHAINLARTEKGWEPWEPQCPRGLAISIGTIKLTEKERHSAWIFIC